MEKDYCKNECIEMQKLNSDLNSIKKDLDRVEEIQGKQGDTIMILTSDSTETKIYMKQVLEKISGFETNINAFQANIFKLLSKDNKMSTKDWIGLLKWVIGGTLFYLIANSAI